MQIFVKKWEYAKKYAKEYAYVKSSRIKEYAEI